MSRYIDADAVKNIIRSGVSTDTEADQEYVCERIDEAPSIDIVRCKECSKAHLTYDGDCKYCEEWKDDDGNYIEVYHDGDHFCSYGERKGE